jgi:hypothetical protein
MKVSAAAAKSCGFRIREIRASGRTSAHAQLMAGMSFRFRKSFKIIPGVLHWTISKKGVSLNLNLGIYSKSWGTGGRRTTTIDMPGTTGMFWRKQQTVKKDPEDADEGFLHLIQLLVIWGGLLFGLARLHLTGITADCHLGGHPHIVLALMLAGELGLVWFLWRSWAPLKGFLGLLLVIGLAYIQWKLYGHLVAPDLHCVK